MKGILMNNNLLLKCQCPITFLSLCSGVKLFVKTLNTRWSPNMVKHGSEPLTKTHSDHRACPIRELIGTLNIVTYF